MTNAFNIDCMEYMKTFYLSRQFAILPAIGIVKGRGEYRCRLSAVWGFWGISIGLGKPLR